MGIFLRLDRPAENQSLRGLTRGPLSKPSAAADDCGGNGSSCRGFRMTAHHEPVHEHRAVVRKPSGKEPAGSGPQRCRRLYGDFGTGVAEAGTDDVAGGVIFEPSGGGGEARVAWQQGSEADLGLAGCWLGRALSRPALGQRDRSAQQRRKGSPGLMRCRCRWRREDTRCDYVRQVRAFAAFILRSCAPAAD